MPIHVLKNLPGNTYVEKQSFLEGLEFQLCCSRGRSEVVAIGRSEVVVYFEVVGRNLSGD